MKPKSKRRARARRPEADDNSFSPEDTARILSVRREDFGPRETAEEIIVDLQSDDGPDESRGRRLH